MCLSSGARQYSERRCVNRLMPRRSFLSLGGPALLGLSLATLRSVIAAPTTQVRFNGWGGPVQKALSKNAFQPYASYTGVSVIENSFANESDILKNLKTAKPGDVQVIHSFGIDAYKRYVDAGWASQINEANIPNLQNVMGAIIAPLRKLTPKLSCVPFNYGTIGIAYNKKFVSDVEAQQKGAMLLMDQKYAGKISGFHDMRTRVWYAALQTNQDPNNISDVGAIWAKVREFRGLAHGFWRSGVELMEILISEDVLIADSWSGRIAALQQQGHPIGFINPLGAYAWMETLVILKGSPMPECETLCNFMLGLDAEISVAKSQNYPPSLDPTKVQLTEKIFGLPSFDQSGTLAGFSFADPGYWAANETAWQEQWYVVANGG